MTMRRTALLAILTLPVAALSQSAGYVTPDGRYRVVGYNDMQEMLGAAADRVAAGGSPIRFRFELNGTRTAPAALIAGTSLMAPMGAEMESGDRAAFRAAWGRDPLVFRIAHDSLTSGTLSSPTAVLVNADNPLRRITLDQVRRIFVLGSGGEGIATWGQLGLRGAWSARPIRRVALAGDTAIGRYLLAGPLHAAAFVGAVDGKRQSRDVAATIAADSAAIGLANANFAGPSVRALPLADDAGFTIAPTRAGIRSGHYAMDRFLLIYVRADADGRIAPAASVLLDSLLSATGQAAIGHESRGYIPLNRDELRAERAKLKKAS